MTRCLMIWTVLRTWLLAATECGKGIARRCCCA